MAKAAGGVLTPGGGLPDGSLFGPIFQFARGCFLLGGLLILIAIPLRGKGWPCKASARDRPVGLLLAAGLTCSTSGFDRTTGVSAFRSHQPSPSLFARSSSRGLEQAAGGGMWARGGPGRRRVSG